MILTLYGEPLDITDEQVRAIVSWAFEAGARAQRSLIWRDLEANGYRKAALHAGTSRLAKPFEHIDWFKP